jgi:hypothetical protein
MCAESAAESMMDAMMSVAVEKSAASSSEAIQALTCFINSIETHEDRDVRKTFAASLVPMYCMRARLYYETASPHGDEKRVELAQNDVRRADATLDEFYAGLASGRLEAARSNIRNVIAPDPKVRIDSLSAIMKLRKIRPSPGAVSRPAAASRPQPGASAGLGAAWMSYVGIFLLGTALWAAALSFLFSAGPAVSRDSSGIAAVIFVAPVLVVGAMGLAGWDWLSQYKSGTYGNFIKFMAFWFIALTGIGMIFVAFWTGKGALRWCRKLA